MFINGHRTEVQSGETFDATNRAQEKSIAKLSDDGREETLKAIEATHGALLPGYHWPPTKGPDFLMMRTKFGCFFCVGCATGFNGELRLNSEGAKPDTDHRRRKHLRTK